MPAIHKLKFRNSVLTFQDSDIIDALSEQGIKPSDKLSHDLFLQGACMAAADSPDVNNMDADDFAALMDADGEELSKGFEFAASSLVQEVYGL